MAQPRVLSLGQCWPDQRRVAQQLMAGFRVEVVAGSTVEEARSLLRSQAFDLVLVNRIFDLDGSSGLGFIRSLKEDPSLASVPVMLVSNLKEAQAEAIAAGALPGFGKAELDAPQTRERLARVLKPSAESAPRSS